MKISRLIDVLSSCEEDEVYIGIDGVLHDIEDTPNHQEATFDGFDEVYPPSVSLTLKD